MDKIAILNTLETKQLYADMIYHEKELEKLLREDSKYRNENSRFLASYGSDCAAVEEALAELKLDAPLDSSGKKLTVAGMEAWITTQKIIEPISNLVIQQDSVTFNCENSRISLEMARKRIDRMKSLMVLRTAQVDFLARG